MAVGERGARRMRAGERSLARVMGSPEAVHVMFETVAISPSEIPMISVGRSERELV